MTSTHVDVVVVGAGAAGLQCAKKLYESGLSVVVVEASDCVGGRIKQSTDFIPGQEIELGAEFIHGSTTLLNEMGKEYGWEIDEIFTCAHGDGGPGQPTDEGCVGLYYLGKENKLLTYDSTDPDFKYLNEVLWEMSESREEETENDPRSLYDYLVDRGVSDRMLALADAGYGNTAGETMKMISYAGTCRFERVWEDHDGEGDFRFKQSSYRIVTEALQKDLNIRLNWPVTSIDYSNPEKVSLYCSGGDIIEASKAVVTVPITILKDGDINFIPPLPEAKRQAMNYIGMSCSCKVLLRFSKPFWPEKCQSVICADTFVPEFWVRTLVGKNQEKTYLVSGFAMGKFAEHVTKHSKEDAIQRLIEQLDMIFASEGNENPASQYFMYGDVHDWSKHPYVRGGYSFPIVGQPTNTSKTVAASVNGKIFFAGEATAVGHPSMTVHSALETGVRAAKEVLQTIHSARL